MQEAVFKLSQLTPKLTDALEQPKMDEAVTLLDSLSHPLSPDDISALMSLLPADGDTACGLNWTILHGIEASPNWPLWVLLKDKENEWVDIFLIRLRNAGMKPA